VTLGTTSLVYGFIRAAEAGWNDGLTLSAFALAALLLTGFVAVERRARQPIMPLRLLAGRTRAGAYLNMLLLPAAMIGMFFFLTQFVQVVLGFSPIEAGLAFLPLTVAIFAVSHVMPRLLPRRGPRPFVVAGAALIAAGMVWLSWISADSDYAGGLLGPLLLLGVGAGFSLVPLSMLILSGVRGEDTGAASGLLQTMQQVGGSLGIAVLVTVFGSAGRDAAAALPGGATPEAQARLVLAEAIGSTFAVGALIAAAALLVAAIATGSGRPTRRGRAFRRGHPGAEATRARRGAERDSDASEAAA
jgi:predicted MFS family arabinose efflux permease